MYVANVKKQDIMQEHVKNKLNVFFNDYNNNKEVC